MDCGRRYSNLKPWRIRKLIQVPRPTCWLPQWIANLTKQNCAPGVDQNMKYLCSRFCDDKNAILGKSWKVADLKKKQIGLLWKVFAEKMALFWDASEWQLMKTCLFKFKKKDIFGRYLEDHELKKVDTWLLNNYLSKHATGKNSLTLIDSALHHIFIVGSRSKCHFISIACSKQKAH